MKKVRLINPNKLLKISNYAKRQGYSRGRIYQLAKSGALNIVEIDHVKFVCLD